MKSSARLALRDVLRPRQTVWRPLSAD